MNWQNADPRPALLVLPVAAASLDEAHAAIELWEHYSGKCLDQAQRVVVEVCMAQDAAGRWAAATTGRAMPRQNGKGDEIEVVELWGLVQRGEAILHTVHDAALLAGQAQGRLLSVLESHPDLRRLVRKVWRGVGQQMVEFRNGGTIWYRTRTKGAGRGLDDVDRVVVDEAQLATVEHIGAVTPTLFANPNPQLNVMGSAGIAGHSGWWWSIRKRALAGDGQGFGFVEHTAERPSLDTEGRVISTRVDVNDTKLWFEANPALVAGRGGGVEFLRAQLAVMGPELFAREHMGVWDPEPGSVPGAIDPLEWIACLEREHRPSGPLSYALDVSPEARSCAVAVSDGRHIEVVKHDAGTHWVVAACAAHRDRFDELVLDPAGPAGALVHDLEAEGLKVRQVKMREAVAACGGFLTAVVDGTVRHIGQPGLDQAVSNADRRSIGDGGWLWSRKQSTVDISPLYAATFARWAAQTADGPSSYEDRGLVSL